MTVENIQMILNAISLKSVSLAKDTLINPIGAILTEKESLVKIESWEAGQKKTGFSISINHENFTETLSWEIKPVKK
jgi:hypothetical protein